MTTAGVANPAELYGARRAQRLDLVLASLAERQVEAVMDGIAVAVVDGSGAEAARGWLGRELTIAVDLVQLAMASGVVVPDALSSLRTDPSQVSRAAHLMQARSRYEATADAVTALLGDHALPPDCLPAAHQLLGTLAQQLAELAPHRPAADASDCEPVGVRSRDVFGRNVSATLSLPGNTLG